MLIEKGIMSDDVQQVVAILRRVLHQQRILAELEGATSSLCYRLSYAMPGAYLYHVRVVRRGCQSYWTLSGVIMPPL